MGAEFGDAPVVQHQHPVGFLNGLQAVGDEDGGASGGQLADGVLDELLGLRVDGGGGFVEHQDFRIRRQHSGEGQQLALTLGKVLAPLREFRVEALRQGLDEVERVGGAGRGDGPLPADRRVAEGDVVEHRS